MSSTSWQMKMANIIRILAGVRRVQTHSSVKRLCVSVCANYKFRAIIIKIISKLKYAHKSENN